MWCKLMEVFISFLAGFGLGWASVWTIFTLGELKAIDQEILEYNNVGGKTLSEIVNATLDSEKFKESN